MIILGIDPGLQVTGYAVVEVSPRGPVVGEAGIIRTSDNRSASSNMAQRLCSLYDGLVEVLDQFHPDAVAVEQLYAHYQHPRTAILMGHARGVICLAAAQAGIPVVHYASTQVKRILTGAGRADKLQMQKAIQRELRLPQLPEPPDVADALAVALCHCYLKDKPGGK